jgi:hypothetical protein
MFKYTNITAQEARNNLRAMQETSITFINEEKKWELHIVLIPRIEFFYGQNRIEIDLYSKIAKLIVEVKDNYTYINTKVFNLYLNSSKKQYFLKSKTTNIFLI